MDEKTGLYKAYDKNGVLLYVGISCKPYSRLKSHESLSIWYKSAEKITIEMYPDRGSALKEEAICIARDVPLHNKGLDSCCEIPEVKSDKHKNMLALLFGVKFSRSGSLYYVSLRSKVSSPLILNFMKTGEISKIAFYKLEQYFLSESLTNGFKHNKDKK